MGYLDSLLGHVGIQPTDKKDEAELRRMSVSSAARRQGVGRHILQNQKISAAAEEKRMILSTVDFLKPALAMYYNNDYSLVEIEPFGAPPNDHVNIHHLVKGLYPVD